jgi:hypothetical protein
MNMTIPASTISAPIRTVELMSFIGGQGENGSTNLTPHAFLKVTDINGNESFVGFAPQVTGLTGSGQIQNDADHPATNSSGPISLTPEQGARLQQYINSSIDNPPYYNLPEGQHCAVWAANGILQAITGHGLDDIGMLGTTQTDFGPFGTIICELFNPYTLAIVNEGLFLDALLCLYTGEFVDTAVSITMNVLETAVEFGQAGLDRAAEIIDSVLNAFNQMKEISADALKSFVESITDMTSKILDAVRETSVDVFNEGMDLLDGLYNGICDKFKNGDFSFDVSGFISSNFTAAQKYIRRYDPLTLDLDGDGIETIAADPNNPILFDHDGDGIKSGTGWIKPDDGFLVLDRTGNGTIDNGTELFGDATPLYAGGTAADGFAALAQEDTNLDGVVNNLDANWNNLRIWRDLNSDGLSQSNELFTMDQAGIADINVANIDHSQTLPGGNQIADLGTYTRTDGSTGTVGEVGQMADVNFAVDTFNREFSDTIPLLPEVESMPDMQGSGLCRDLQEAASISPALASVLSQYSLLTTRQEQQALLDTLLDAWADTSGLAETMEERDEDHFRIVYNRFDNILRLNNYVTGGSGSGGSGGSGEGMGVYIKDTENPRLTESYRQLIAEWSRKLHILEAFNGRYFFTFPEQTQEGGSAVTGMTVGSGGYVGGGYMGNGDTAQYLVIEFDQPQLTMFAEAYKDLRESVYQTLFYQTRFQTEFAPLLDKIELVIGEDNSITYDFSQLEQYFCNEIAASAYHIEYRETSLSYQV